MTKFLSIIALLFCLSGLNCSLAQDFDYYYDSYYNCQPSGTETVWNIKAYRDGSSSSDINSFQNGTLTFSDDCIEFKFTLTIDGESQPVTYHFPVKNYKRLSPNSFCVFRQGEDSFFDYIEVEPDGSSSTGRYRVILALNMQDEGILLFSKIFFCRPKSVGGKSVGLPPQALVKQKKQ